MDEHDEVGVRPHQQEARRQMMRCLAITLGVALFSLNESGVIPFHGFFLKLGLFEWTLAVWLPVGAAVFATPATPRRWWVYFSLISLIIVLLGVHTGVFYTLWGRRPWMPSQHWKLKLAVLAAYVLLTTTLVGLLATHIKATRAGSPGGDAEQ